MHGAPPPPHASSLLDRQEREESVDVAPPTALSSLDLLSGVAAQRSAEERQASSSFAAPLHPSPQASSPTKATSIRLPSLQHFGHPPRSDGAGGGKRARHSLYPPQPPHNHQQQHQQHPPHPHYQYHPSRSVPSSGFAPPRPPRHPPRPASPDTAERTVYHFHPPNPQGEVSGPSPSVAAGARWQERVWEDRRYPHSAGGGGEGGAFSSTAAAHSASRPPGGPSPAAFQPQQPRQHLQPHLHSHPHNRQREQPHQHLSYTPLYERRGHASASSSQRPSSKGSFSCTVDETYRRPPPRKLDTSFISSYSTLKLPPPSSCLPTPVSAPLSLPSPAAAGGMGAHGLSVSAQGRTIYSTPSAEESGGRRGSLGARGRRGNEAEGAGGGGETAKGLVVGNVKGMDPIVSSTLWEDERTIVMQVLVEGHVVARRADNDWINSTKLLNMAGLTRGKRDMYLKNEPQRVVFRRGALHLKGVWRVSSLTLLDLHLLTVACFAPYRLPLEAAERLAKSYNLHSRLYPLFEPRIQKFLFTPLNRDRTTQLVRAARAREAMPRPEDEQGIGEEERIEREERTKALERLLRRLEIGLGLVEREDGDSEDGDEDASNGDEGAGEAEEQTSTSLATQYPANSLHAASSSASLPGEPPLVTASHYAASSHTHQAGDDTAPRSGPSFALSLQHLQRLQSSSPAASRRPSLHVGFTHDFHGAVSWYDNPTPPEGAMGEYISAGDIARRLSTASALGDGADERELDAVMEGEEVSEWGTEGVLAKSRPPPVLGGFGLTRRMSAPVLQAATPAMPADQYGSSRGGAQPETAGAGIPPCSAPLQQHLVHIAPSAGSHPGDLGGYSSVNRATSSAVANAGPPLFALGPPASHRLHQPDEDRAPALDLPALLADLQELQQQRSASPSFVSSNPATCSPLARLNATRLSIDSAAEVVYPHVGLGSQSLVAPHAQYAEQHEAAAETAASVNYSWAPPPLPAHYGNTRLQSHPAPSTVSLPLDDLPRPAPSRVSFSKQYLAALSAATSVGPSSALTITSPSASAVPSGFLSTSASASPEAFYSFPAPSASAVTVNRDDHLVRRSGSKRILAELDTAEAENSYSNAADNDEPPYELPHSLSSSRRGLTIALEAATFAGQARGETPRERRDSISGVMDVEMSRAVRHGREKEGDREILIRPRSPKRRKIEDESAEVVSSSEGGGEETIPLKLGMQGLEDDEAVETC
ncbi:hypothetical protein JCM11251_001811 [Rhodosporidiobolus azoricus]